MFQYTREVILNKDTYEISAFTDAKEGNGILIKNVGTYRTKHIPQALIVKGVASSTATATVPAPSTTLFPAGQIGRYIVKLGLQSGEVDALLANYTTWFKRDIIIEIPAGATAAKIKEAFKLAFTGLEEFPVWYDETAHAVKAKTPYVTIQIGTETFVPRTPSAVVTEGIWNETSAGTKVKGFRGFGNYYQLVKDNRLPTMENIRPWGEAIEEYPIKGTLYSMVELTYVADRNIGGFGVLGQKATSVTKHRFWVPSTDTATLALLSGVAQEVVEEEAGE